jgi:predicted dehydrogenase
MAAAAAQQEGGSGPQVFMLAENSSFWPEVARAKQLLDEGAIGAPVTARAHYYEALNASPFADEAEWLGWRKDLAICGCGIVMDGGQHWLRPMRCATFLSTFSAAVSELERFRFRAVLLISS